MMFACPLGNCSKKTKKAPQISNILNNDSIDLTKINKLLTKITELKENNDIINNPEFEWNFNILAYHKNITWDIIQNNLDKNWDLMCFSYNPNLNIEIMQNN